MSSRYTELTSQLRSLKLSTMAESFSDIALKAVRTGLSHEAFLHELVRLECEAREQRRRARLLSESGLPREKHFGTLQLGAFPPLIRQQIERLRTGAFVQQAINVVAVGKPGAGKTHLAIALGTKMIQLGYSVRFVTAQAFANAVLAAPGRSAVERVLRPLIQCDLLILDELGYLPLEPQLGSTIYELISGRYQKGATVITSNKSLATWGEVVAGDTALMMAILDRLLHHGEVFYLRGQSYRLRGKEPLVVASSEGVGGDRLPSL